MNNALLGKTVKAMYKLSGKTLQQLSDETELTIDTINNLFYARIQKPGFAGVCAMVNACGYKIEHLTGFIAKAENLPESADITDEFTKYLFSLQENDTAALPAVHSGEGCSGYCGKLSEIQKEFDQQLEQYRGLHQSYVDQLHAQYEEQIEQMEETDNKLKAHFDHSVGEIKKAHAEELSRQEDEIRQLRHMNLILTMALIGLCLIGLVGIFLFKR